MTFANEMAVRFLKFKDNNQALKLSQEELIKLGQEAVLLEVEKIQKDTTSVDDNINAALEAITQNKKVLDQLSDFIKTDNNNIFEKIGYLNLATVYTKLDQDSAKFDINYKILCSYLSIHAEISYTEACEVLHMLLAHIRDCIDDKKWSHPADIDVSVLKMLMRGYHENEKNK